MEKLVNQGGLLMKENKKYLLKKLSWLLIKAFYPDEFTDLDPQKYLEGFYKKSMPIDYKGVWMKKME